MHGKRGNRNICQRASWVGDRFGQIGTYGRIEIKYTPEI